jgi:hypothetical protein
MNEWSEKVSRLDFDRLDMLVSERIGMLKIIAANGDKIGKAHEQICRDLVWPNVALLANFIEAVKISEHG